MTKEKIKRILADYGLSDKEITLYLTGLNMGPTLASDLAKKTDFTRPNVYDLLNSLKQKGLVSVTGKTHSQRFIMDDPDKLIFNLNKKRRDIDRLEKKLKDVMPELLGLVNVKSGAPQFRYYDSLDGISLVLKDTLNSKTEIMSLIPMDGLIEIFGKESSIKFIEQSVRLGIKRKTLLDRQPDWSFYKDHQKHLRQVRYAPENFKITIALIIYNNKVAIISTAKEKYVLLIESNDLSLVLKQYFELLWQVSKEK